jgi:hypothetical protein
VNRLPLAVLAIITGLSATAQGVMDLKLSGSFGFSGSSGTAKLELITTRTVITSAPFSAEVIEETFGIGPDGKRTKTGASEPRRVYRDVLGRTRQEGPVFPAPPRVPVPDLQLIQIDDPVRVVFHLVDARKQIAYRIQYTPGPPRPMIGPRIQITTESLGSKLIQGVQAQGELRTYVLPAGARGNDRPISETAERWRIRAGDITLLRITTQNGSEYHMELRDFNLASPPVQLFEPPEGFEIRDVPLKFSFDFEVPSPPKKE